jgi:hypothetical protein
VTFTNYLSCNKSNVWGFSDLTAQEFYGRNKESEEKETKKHRDFSMIFISNLKIL